MRATRRENKLRKIMLAVLYVVAKVLGVQKKSNYDCRIGLNKEECILFAIAYVLHLSSAFSSLSIFLVELCPNGVNLT